MVQPNNNSRSKPPLPQPKLKTDWFKDLPVSEQENFKQIVLGSKKVLDKLAEIVYNRGIIEDRVTTDHYDSPSWSHKQAHLNGKREAYKEIIDLITIKDH